jgi:hypothetical protein
MAEAGIHNLVRCAALGIALLALPYARAQTQMQTAQEDQQQMEQQRVQQQLLQQQRRQELRSMMRQQRPSPALNTAAATAPTTPASAVLGNGPRRLSSEEKNELRRQLARDLRMAQVNRP